MLSPIAPNATTASPGTAGRTARDRTADGALAQRSAPADWAALAAAKYVSLTTYRRNGDAVSTPVWTVELADGRLGVYTSSTSGKVKRLRHTTSVLVQPCDGRGRPAASTAPIAAAATLVGGPLLEDIHARARRKYGVATAVMRLVNTARGACTGRRKPNGDIGIAIAPA